ncbi:hypothetical protein DWW59_08075 [Firmicutes bacterium AF16-15]|nr:hypothetical protein DWW59_08075 [Firmicutes bacterium AF16-15]
MIDLKVQGTAVDISTLRGKRVEVMEELTEACVAVLFLTASSCSDNKVVAELEYGRLTKELTSNLEKALGKF